MIIIKVGLHINWRKCFLDVYFYIIRGRDEVWTEDNNSPFYNNKHFINNYWMRFL